MNNEPEVYVKYKEGYGKIKICARSAFSVWLRYPPWDAKSEGFTNNDVDINIRNYKTKQWFLMEEKTHGVTPEWYQLESFKTIHKSIKDPNYMGYHLILFSNTTPDDSHTIMLNNVVITREDLIEFLRFKKPNSWYETTMFNTPNKPIEIETRIVNKHLKDRQEFIDAQPENTKGSPFVQSKAEADVDNDFPTAAESRANRQVHRIEF